jgi:heptosyltransferase II
MRKILIVAPNWIGDCLMAQPLLMRLKEKLGQVSLHALASAAVAPVLKRMPELDEVISTPFVHGPLQLKERWRLGRALRGLGYAQAIVLPNTWKSALVPFFADIPLRSGYVGESRYGLLNLTYTLDKKNAPPMVQRYGALADAPMQTPSAKPPVFAHPALRQDRAATATAIAKFGLSAHCQIAVLAPGAEYGPAKRWPIDYFAQLARNLHAQGMAIWIVGGEKDRTIGDAMARETKLTLHNLCGNTSLDEAISLIDAATVVVSNDSGLMHIAAALGKPQVAVFGSSSATHTPPLNARARVAEIPVKDLPCRPCFARECPLGHFRCMRELTPARVGDEVAQALMPTRIAD